jgi:hypothetical protein
MSFIENAKLYMLIYNCWYVISAYFGRLDAYSANFKNVYQFNLKNIGLYLIVQRVKEKKRFLDICIVIQIFFLNKLPYQMSALYLALKSYKGVGGGGWVSQFQCLEQAEQLYCKKIPSFNNPDSVVAVFSFVNQMENVLNYCLACLWLGLCSRAPILETNLP